MTDQPITRTKRGLDIGAAAELADLFHELSHDPKVRGELGRVIKKARPDSPHARAFFDVEVDDKIETLRKEQADRDLKTQQDAVLSRMNAQRASLLTGDTGRKYSEDDVKQIEALMEKKGISDYEDGAILWASTQPPITKPGNEPTQHGTTWEFPEWADFGKDPIGASRRRAQEVIAEFQRRRA